jgi:hypothetical protein
MNASGQVMLDKYPAFMRDDPTIQAICNAVGPENDAAQAVIDQIANELEPVNADQLLSVWEFAMGSSASDNATQQERLAALLARIQRAGLDGRGVSWERLARLALGSNWTYSVGGTNNSVLTVTTVYSNTSLQGQLARAVLSAITPATMTIVINEGTGGFLLDESLLDVGTLE